MNNYIAYHVHSDYSMLDSCTKFEDYIQRAVELKQPALASTEHGKPLEWISKKLKCEEAGIKFIFGVEAYLSELPISAYHGYNPDDKVRDNYHTVLLARNYDGVREINEAINKSTDKDHFYYDNRITFDEFLALSNNVIAISACLASPLNRLDMEHPAYDALARRYDFFEIQPHNHIDQIRYNQRLLFLSEKYGTPLIAGTDTHNLNKYKAECREILMESKRIMYSNEDAFNLTYRTYDELVQEFATQDAIPEKQWMKAIENTNMLVDIVEDFTLDRGLKYPIMYGSPDNDREHFIKNVDTQFVDKVEKGIIPPDQVEAFSKDIAEEKEIFSEIGMCGFMQSMSEIVSWCKENDIAIGPGRGSVCGSRIAYVTDITDVNPVQWKTVFSRFVSRDRKHDVGDIDVDVITEDRPRIFEYLIKRFGQGYTARVPAYSTLADKATIDTIGRALGMRWDGDPDKNPYSLSRVEKIKKEYDSDPEATREKYSELFYYFDGIVGTCVAQSLHAAGIVISPVTLTDNYGTFWKDGEVVLEHDMDAVHDVNLVKYDFLGLRNVKIIRDACRLANIKFPRVHEMDWHDDAVWNDMLRTHIGLFQFEEQHTFSSLRQYKPKSVEDVTIVTAAIRPSGASYRDDLLAHKPHKNPSKLIDDLLQDNNGYLVYQEDIIKFLQQICGFSGSAADTIRRGIAKKNKEMLDREMPKLLDGYCSRSDKPREVAEEEAKEFLTIIEDSSAYMFGYNHAIAYSIITYWCAWLRYHYPIEFITSLLNNAANEEDISNGHELAQIYGIIIEQPRFGHSKYNYAIDYDSHSISKGIESVKSLNATVPGELYDMAHEREYKYLSDVIIDAKRKTSLRSDQLDALVDIGYFDGFCNIPTARNIRDAVEFFKYGDAATIKKDKAGICKEFIAKHARGVTKAGKDSTQWTLTDVMAILHDFEEYQISLRIKDLSLAEKAQVQIERLGYADLTTGAEKDRRSVIVVSKVMPLNSKKDGKPWCYKFDAKSIGTGKVVRCSVRPGIFQHWPFKEGDTLRIRPRGMTMDKGGYWWITDYDYLFDLDDYKE